MAAARSLTPGQRSLRARIAAHAMHAAGKTNTRPASAAFLRRFELAVDPAGALTPEERSRRAEHACKAHMAALSLKASQARARKNAPAVEKPGAFEGGRRRVRADDPRAA